MASISQRPAKLGDANSTNLQWHEARSRFSQWIDSNELGRSKPLHVDAVAEERVPVQIVFRVGDQDRRTEDLMGKLIPDEIQFGTTG